MIIKKLEIPQKLHGKRIERVLEQILPELPANMIYKLIRKHNVRLNGIKTEMGQSISAGDIIEIYLPDSYAYEEHTKRRAGTDIISKGFEPVYIDVNLLIVNKAQGLSVHPDRKENETTLVQLAAQYLGQTEVFLCHRLDRNTGGLVMIARNKAALAFIQKKIKLGEITKLYKCVVNGKMERKSGLLKAYLMKDENKSLSTVSNEKKPGTLPINTRYSVLAYSDSVLSRGTQVHLQDGLSLLEVEPLTGRTHQIRAHLAFEGHPVAGDGKYGKNAINRTLGLKFQALWAYKIIFDFKDQSGLLGCLRGKTFEIVPPVPSWLGF